MKFFYFITEIIVNLSRKQQRKCNRKFAKCLRRDNRLVAYFDQNPVDFESVKMLLSRYQYERQNEKLVPNERRISEEIIHSLESAERASNTRIL